MNYRNLNEFLFTDDLYQLNNYICQNTQFYNTNILIPVKILTGLDLLSNNLSDLGMQIAYLTYKDLDCMCCQHLLKHALYWITAYSKICPKNKPHHCN
jgi:hypothetical protein